jgi:hypothetical protein
MLDFITNQKNNALADRFTEMFRTQNKKKAAKALFMGVSPLMLAACGGGSGTTEVRVNDDENSAEATRLSLVDQFNSKVAYSDIPGLRVFTEGTLVPVASDRDFSLMEIRASGDFNGDGLDDILYAHSDTLAVPKILASNGDGTFGGNVEIFGHQEVRHIRNTEVIDLDGDGDLDIVAFTAPHGWYQDLLGSNWDSTEPDIIYYNNGNNSFTAVALQYETYNHGGAVGDLDGDGVLEIFSLSEYPRVAPYSTEEDFRGPLVRNEDGTYVRSGATLPEAEFNGLVTSDMRIADLNGDGFEDLIIAVSPDFGDTAGRDGSPNEVTPSFKVGLSDGSLDPEGYTWSSYGAHQMSSDIWDAFVSQNSDATEFSAGVSNIELMDIDGDNDLDVVVGYYISAGGSWITSGFNVHTNTNGIFADETAELFPNQDSNLSITNPTSFILGFHHGDLNNDGNMDLVLETKTADYWISGNVSHNIFVNDGAIYHPLQHDNASLDHSIATMTYSRPLHLNNDTFIDMVGVRSSDADFQIISALNEGII